MSKKSLIVICGPTGSGKTSLAVELAGKIGAPILSTDSRQLFKGMAIGTAQPTAEELARADHHMIACHEPEEHYTSGRYERDALAILERLFHKTDTVIAVGGSGLYINALCHGMDEMPHSDPSLRRELEGIWQAGGRDILLDRLRELDPQHYQTVDKANPRRIIRAIEVCVAADMPYSTLRGGANRKRNFDILKIGIAIPREQLYSRINSRVDEMIAAGLEQEARALYPKRDLNSLQTVGYKEMFEYFDGAISQDRAVELIKQNTRHYAKRQMTWFSKQSDIHWLDPLRQEEIISLIAEFALRPQA